MFLKRATHYSQTTTKHGRNESLIEKIVSSQNTTNIRTSSSIINHIVSLLIPSVSAMLRFEICRFVVSSSPTHFTLSSLRVEMGLPEQRLSSSDLSLLINELPTCKLSSLSVLHLHKLCVISCEYRHHHLPVLQETSWWHVAPLSTCLLFSTEAVYTKQYRARTIQRTKLKFTRVITDGHLQLAHLVRCLQCCHRPNLKIILRT